MALSRPSALKLREYQAHALRRRCSNVSWIPKSSLKPSYLPPIHQGWRRRIPTCGRCLSMSYVNRARSCVGVRLTDSLPLVRWVSGCSLSGNFQEIGGHRTPSRSTCGPRPPRPARFRGEKNLESQRVQRKEGRQGAGHSSRTRSQRDLGVRIFGSGEPRYCCYLKSADCFAATDLGFVSDTYGPFTWRFSNQYTIIQKFRTYVS